MVEYSGRLKRFQSQSGLAALKKNFGIFFYFFRFIKPYKSKIGLGIVSLLLATPFGILSTYLTKPLVDEVVLATDKSLAERVSQFWYIIGLQVLLWFIGRMIVNVQAIVSWYVDLKVTIDIQRNYYTHVQNLPLAWHRTRAIGENMYRTSEDLVQGDHLIQSRGGIIGMITHDWVQIFVILYDVVWYSAFMALIDWRLSVIVAAYLGPWTVATHYLNSWYKKIDFENREIQQERHAVMRDVVAGLKTFKSLGRTRFAANRYVQILLYCQRMYMRKMVANWIGNRLVIWSIKQIGFERGLWVYVFYQTIIGNFSIGEITVVLVMVHRLLKPFEDLVNLIQNFRLRLIPAERMLETLNVQPTIVEDPHPVTLPSLKGEITFDRVTFGYTPDRILLRDVSFTIPPGQRVAFVGPSGAGKSTVLNLVLRLYDPMGGRILVDGAELKKLRMKRYLDLLGVVLQDTFLFSGTIDQNIRYGNPYVDAPEVLKAVDMADLHDLVDKSPEGIETFLGEGTKISGGQKQRIGVARACLRRPSMYLMDEPTAHLDIIAETHVFKTIEKVTRGRTTLIVSHRLAPIQFVDRLVVLTPEGVEAIGTHAELLAKSPTYAALWREQQSQGGMAS